FRSGGASRHSTGGYRWKLSAAKRNRARFGFVGGNKKTRGDHEIFRFPSAGRIDHRTRPDEIECATSFRSAVRFESSEHGGISFCASLFHRKKGTQHATEQWLAQNELTNQ